MRPAIAGRHSQRVGMLRYFDSVLADARSGTIVGSSDQDASDGVLIYFLGHLTPIMTEVTRSGYRLVYFMAQLFDTVFPGLDLFDVGSAVVRDVPLPAVPYALYTLNVTLYALTYTTIALLFGLILFEDRDLA